MRTLKVLLIMISFLSLSAMAEVQYQIHIKQPEHHLAQVEMQLDVSQPGALTLSLPAWRSGKYQILDLANGVSYFQASMADGQPVPFQKTEKSSWQLQLPAAGTLKVSYQIYANELGGRTRHIDDTHAYINASAYLMFSPKHKDLPLTVQLDVPAQWKSYSGMEHADNEHSFKAANYDVVADSPIETGINQYRSFEVDGRSYGLVVWGEGNYNLDQMQQDLAKLVATTGRIWQGHPFSRYLFIVHAADGARGATEHLNSTVIQKDRFGFAKREDYLGFLSTASHELVHTWNVKAYRPADLVPYDYLQPNYSKLLWISEGSTSYFEDQLLLQAGLMKKEEFYKGLAKLLNRFMHTPGRQVQSVAQSSFDNWIAQGGDHAANYSVNIYSEGFIASWLLDQWMLENSNNKVSYRDLHNQLYQRFGKTTAFTAENVKQIAKDLTGESLDSFWATQVESPLAFEPAALLKSFGLEWQADKEQEVFSGVSGTDQQGFTAVTKVERDSPAWIAGLTSEDLIVAVNGLQLKAGLTERLKDFKAGDKVELSYFRKGRLQQTTLAVRMQPKGPGVIKAVAKPSRQQKAQHKAWLGVEL
ncbi:M61 family metallopeptidase [Rheinheimera marina]|uniref:M61 family metallopeptidase n=1 Tax=Rheinheimera marina TaxID=1774958 RepID=A0ABV9JKW8_9GAMM